MAENYQIRSGDDHPIAFYLAMLVLIGAVYDMRDAFREVIDRFLPNNNYKYLRDSSEELHETPSGLIPKLS